MNSIRKQSFIRSIFLLAILSLLVSCSNAPKSLPTDATFIDNLYNNKFFSFQIKLPEGWYSVNEETMQAVSDYGKDLIAGDDKNMEASIKAAQKNVYNLVSAFQVAPETPIEYYNSNISCIAERVSHLPGIKNGEDYLLNAKQLISSGQLNLLFDEEIQNHNIGGKDFYSINASIDIMGNKIEQQYYATYQNGFILALVVSYSGSDQLSTIDKTINSIEFY